MATRELGTSPANKARICARVRGAALGVCVAADRAAIMTNKKSMKIVRGFMSASGSSMGKTTSPPHYTSCEMPKLSRSEHGSYVTKTDSLRSFNLFINHNHRARLVPDRYRQTFFSQLAPAELRLAGRVEIAHGVLRRRVGPAQLEHYRFIGTLGTPGRASPTRAPQN